MPKDLIKTFQTQSSNSIILLGAFLHARVVAFYIFPFSFIKVSRVLKRINNILHLTFNTIAKKIIATKSLITSRGGLVVSVAAQSLNTELNTKPRLESCLRHVFMVMLETAVPL